MLTRALFAILFLLSIHHLSAQSLTIKNGDLSKTFGPDTFYEMYFIGESTDCCYTIVNGIVERVYVDSVKIRVNGLGLNIESLDFKLNLGSSISEKELSLTFSKEDLVIMQGFKSRKKYKQKSKWSSLGGVLLVTGLVTFANSYDFDDKSFRNGVLISGGVQIGLAIISGSIGGKKRYRTSAGWHF